MRLTGLVVAFLIALAASSAGAWAQDRLPEDNPIAESSVPHGPALTAPDLARDEDRPESGRDACAGRERTLRLGPPDTPQHVGLKTYPQTLRLRDHEVVLTFDDGPSPKTTPRVLAALKAACVHATFFLIGRNTAAHPDLARRERADGHSVGHHSMTHPSFTLRGFDEVSGEADIDAGVLADEAALYGRDAWSPRQPHTPFFRFPGFADTPALLGHLDERHYIVFGTDLWAADWKRMTPDFERRKVLDLLEAAPRHNGIILFHDTIESTAQMLPAFLDDLRRRGYTVVHLVYDAKAPPAALSEAGEGWSSETETIIASLRTKIVPGRHHAGEAGHAVEDREAPRDGPVPASVRRRPADASGPPRCDPQGLEPGECGAPAHNPLEQ